MVYHSMCDHQPVFMPSSSSPTAQASSSEVTADVCWSSSSSLFVKEEEEEKEKEKGINVSMEKEKKEDELGCSLLPAVLELAADDDVEGFKKAVSVDPGAIHGFGLWYGRKKRNRKSSNHMGLEQWTPLMVAAAYGSVDVLGLILSMSTVDEVNRCCGEDRTTALHCAVAGGSVSAVETVRLLLLAGADPNCVDADGNRPVDVVSVFPKSWRIRIVLENLLGQDGSTTDSTATMASSELDSRKDSFFYPTTPMDPSSPLPDIKNSLYATDEFRMFSFKVRPCSRAYSHDWTECPFAHPGENAKRRDPRKFHYSCVPCPDFRKGGVCRRGDMCEYAHGVFECYLHPAQYRTRPCKEGTSCVRRVCFFAHTPEELRPVYGSGAASAGSSTNLMSPRAAMDMATALNMNFSNGSPPSHNPIPWPQPNVPTLHLPMGNLQASRLRSALSARDMSVDEFGQICSRMKSSNLEDVFAAEMSSSLSPRYNSEVQQMSPAATLSLAQKSAILNQLQQWHQKKQSMLSPIKTTDVFSPNGQVYSLGPGRMSSPRSIDPISPMGSRLAALAHMEKQQHMQMRSLSSRELGSGISAIVGSPVNSSLAEWGSPSGKLDWAVNGEELGRLRRSNSFEMKAKRNGEEQQHHHHLHLQQQQAGFSFEDDDNDGKNQIEDVDVVGSWLEDAIFH